MYTRGRKKAEVEPTPPARDPHDVETIERLQQRIQELEDEEEEYHFLNKYPSFQEEPIVLVEEESSLVYDTDNEEEESMPVYDTDIEDVIEEEEGL
ncbi:hypothetical protein Tco_0499793 [Tanacetum coccineum]